MNRVKVSVSVDPQLLNAVDIYVQEHKGVDRSKVIDQALGYWTAAQQESAMEAQFADSVRPPRTELESWRSISRAAAKRLIPKS